MSMARGFKELYHRRKCNIENHTLHHYTAIVDLHVHAVVFMHQARAYKKKGLPFLHMHV